MALRVLLACLLIAGSTFSIAANDPAGKNLRWSSQGDIATLDPHSQNETFNNGMNNQVYEYLAMRSKLAFEKYDPALAVSWTNPSPLKWIFKLRQGVKFQDGSPFTADDVVFSFNRARESLVTFKLYSTQSGVAKKIDDYTVEFTTPVPNPVMMDTITNIMIMSKTWCEKYKVMRPQEFKNKEETYAVRNAMGTGPYILVKWEPDVKALYKKNPDWWGIKEGIYDGNVETIEYRPIANAATRMAALKSGEVDFVLDPPVQNVTTLKEDSDLKVWEGKENRVVFLGFDQARSELLYSDVKGKNPFKDRRVRQAMYQAIDIAAIKSQVMRGLSSPTAIPFQAGTGAGVPESTGKALSVRRERGEKTDGGSGLSQRLRFHADLSQRPLHQRRKNLRGGGRHVGAHWAQRESGSDAQGALFSEGREARCERLSAGLGRRIVRCDFYFKTGDAQQEQPGRRRRKLWRREK